MEFPFNENKITDNIFIREFKSDIDIEDLVWHRDKEDRIIEVISNTGWYLQMDNELPILIEGQIFIPKETYHRVIKGTGDLIIKLTKLKLI